MFRMDWMLKPWMLAFPIAAIGKEKVQGLAL